MIASSVVVMMLSSSIVGVLFVVLIILPVIRLGCRNVLLIVYFMCMVVLVLRITYGQVVLLGLCLTLWLDN
jgi:hypothetical protein